MFSLLQSFKKSFPIDDTEDGINIDVNDEQPLKAKSPIDIIDVGIDIDDNAMHLSKAPFPISDKNEGIWNVTCFKE